MEVNAEEQGGEPRQASAVKAKRTGHGGTGRGGWRGGEREEGGLAGLSRARDS